MNSCPYPTHQGSSDPPPSSSLITYCSDGCGRTFFFCGHCGQANRPAARFCRQCGEPILFEENQAELDLVRPQQEGRTESYRLSEYGVTEAQALIAYKGFLIVVADQSVLIYDVYKIYEPLYQFRPADRRVIRGVTIVGSDSDEQLLITTSRSVYRLSLLNMQPEIASVYEAAGDKYITQPAVSCDNQIYVLELDQRQQSSRLVRLPGEEVFSFAGRGRSLVSLTENRFFFCTQDQVFLYDGGKVLQKQFPEPLMEADAAYNPESDLIYLVGENGLWRVVVSNEELAIVSLPTRNLGAPLLAAGTDNLFVAHTQGFLALDPFGGLRWDSVSQHIRAESDGHRPQVTANYVLFTALGLTGGSKLRIHALNDLNDFRTFDYDQRLVCPPLLTLGRILSVTGGAGQTTLNCVV